MASDHGAAEFTASLPDGLPPVARRMVKTPLTASLGWTCRVAGPHEAPLLHGQASRSPVRPETAGLQGSTRSVPEHNHIGQLQPQRIAQSLNGSQTRPSPAGHEAAHRSRVHVGNPCQTGLASSREGCAVARPGVYSLNMRSPAGCRGHLPGTSAARCSPSCLGHAVCAPHRPPTAPACPVTASGLGPTHAAWRAAPTRSMPGL
jgi:hypothetical protein